MNTVRLAKYIADAGICSRRQASRLIDEKRVMVNGRSANHIDHVTHLDNITVDGEPLTEPAEKVYFAINKPIGIDCKLIESKPESLIHLLPKTPRLYPIGRLDKDSHGLLLLTNDGELCQKLNHPSYQKEKEYRVTTISDIDNQFCQKMMQGVPVKGQITQPCLVTQSKNKEFYIVLTQGLNRQIRRMTKYCGSYVTDLQRIRIANLTLAELNLQPGELIQVDKHKIIS